MDTTKKQNTSNTKQDEKQPSTAPTTETNQNSEDSTESEKEKGGGFVLDLFTKLLSVGEDGFNKAKDLSIPKDLLTYGKDQISVFRKEITNIAGKELNQFFKSINLGQEIAKILTYLTFEIKMQIRLVPSEKGGLKPETKLQVEKVETDEKETQG